MGRRLVDRLVVLRDGEAATAVMMFAYSFLAMTAYNILKPITRSQFISALGADNLPYVQLAAGLLIGVVMQGYSKAASLLPRRHLIPMTLATEARSSSSVLPFLPMTRGNSPPVCQFSE